MANVSVDIVRKVKLSFYVSPSVKGCEADYWVSNLDEFYVTEYRSFVVDGTPEAPPVYFDTVEDGLIYMDADVWSVILGRMNTNISPDTGDTYIQGNLIEDNTWTRKPDIEELQSDVATLQSSPPAHGHTASEVSDFNTAADARITAQKGSASGLCPLDSGSKVPTAYLPSYVDDVDEYANLGTFPGTGLTGKIYVDQSNGKIYRWSGSAYIEISPSPGSTDSVTEGSTNLYHTAERAREAFRAYEGTTAKDGAFPIFKDVTVSSGTAVFHLTDDGTSGGNAIFPNGPIFDSLNVFVSDHAASYQWSAALSNGNKTLTVTINKLTTANILTGILGQSSAPNGTVVRMGIWGN